jgi:hypothetical protein
MTMNLFAVQQNAKPDKESIRDLNFAVVELTTIQLTKLPLYHKISKTGTICFAKPGLTENFHIVNKAELSVTYVDFTKAKRVHERQTRPFVRRDTT